MPKQTRAQREWRPGQVQAPRSVKTLFASTVLCLEGVLMFFFSLAAWGLNQNEWFAWWLLGGSVLLGVIMILTCAVLQRPGGFILGWVLQFVMTFGFVAVALLTSEGLIVPLAIIPGLAFMACWWYAVSKGEQLDDEKMERFLAEEALAQNAPSEEKKDD
jgi:FtsH-binding integral membrane protein